MQALTTERLLIRELSIVDAAFMLRLMNAPNWIRFIGDRNVKTISDASNYISSRIISSYRTNGFGLYLVTLKNTRKPIGICGLVKREGLNHPDLGFAILPEYERMGYASEAATAVLDYAGNILRLKQVEGITTKSNLASVSVLEKAGMHYVKNIQLPGDDADFMLFSRILQTEPLV
ncbi:MAG: GNAT family N-acetyltransferase [Sediminibacterium sp.]|nr:GNAT family N-acetyltransferase [Sediminibacterium sp.]